MLSRKIILRGSRDNMVRAIGSIGEPVFVVAGSNLLQTGPQILEMESVQANSLRSWPPRPIVDGWVDERDYEPAFEEDEWGEGFEDDPANPDA